jgi:DNA-binding GntR family transcriptional regulator
VGGDHVPELRYAYVVRVITERIEAGEYTPGRRLPPEKDLAAELGVSYMTVRRAMQILRERDLVSTIWGLGTFVRSPAAGPNHH